jgi:hypothetical protein
MTPSEGSVPFLNGEPGHDDELERALVDQTRSENDQTADARDIHFLADSLWAIHCVAPDIRVMPGRRAVPAALCSVGYPRVANTMEVVEDLLAAPPQPLPAVVDRLRDPDHFRNGSVAPPASTAQPSVARRADEAFRRLSQRASWRFS